MEKVIDGEDGTMKGERKAAAEEFLESLKESDSKYRDWKIVELEKFCKKNNPVCAVLCIPKSAAEEIVTRLINAGIKGFWNFSHYDLTVHKGIIVENVHLTDSLMTLAYGLNHADDE